MTPYDPKLFDLILKKYKDRFLLVTFKQGYAGHLVLRIITSSHQYYCKEDDPLRFPDSIEGFPILANSWLDFKTQHLSCVHLNDVVICPWIPKEVIEIKEGVPENYLNYLKILKDTDDYLTILTHDFSREEKYPEIKRIRIFGNFNDSYRHHSLSNSRLSFKEVKPSNNKLVYNLNINKLLSEDYKEFEDEYLKLTWTFNLDCKVNSVRSFILLWREKQKRLAKS